MKAWFQSLAPRERALVAGGGVVLVAVLLYLAAVEPMAKALAERTRRVSSLESELAWMRQAAREVDTLRAAGATGGGSDRPAYLAVDDVLRGSGLPQPDRLEPAGDGGARLEFKRVPFDPMVRVLDRLRSEHGLRVTRARFERLDDGVVSARLTLERPAS